ncbi:NAD(P)-dependent oxidoreductase [Cryobacterium arcticum]|uniref:NAD(P)-binding domain-containing protein n=1 Tax=Cryobacterium arcticum TaxID=670052 RepID=A0A317ZPQ5_9MICO|nr:NAD(P)H-binding protein [Cryobacterium arcticum]PXA67099.1 hypothetical protein CTB96_10020 [Cryobacterium arcticum]
MSTLAIFGATGKTGRRVLDRVLAAKYDVRVLVRDPEKLPRATRVQPSLTIVHGDVLNSADVDRTVRDSRVVLALFGQVKGSTKTLQADGTDNLVAAMSQHGVRRIVTLAGGGLRADGRDDLADFILTQIDDRTFIHQMPFVSN